MDHGHGTAGQAARRRSPMDQRRSGWGAVRRVALALLLALVGLGTLLPAGRALAAGPGTWSDAGTVGMPRSGHTATYLPKDNKVLVAGGIDSSYQSLNTAQLYDPDTKQAIPVKSLKAVRAFHTATYLSNGMVLVAGGLSGAKLVGTTEVYDPKQNLWFNLGSVITPRAYHTATVLTNGKVLIAGGQDGSLQPFVTAQLYDPKNNTVSSAAPLKTARFGHTATVLADGKVLVAGGYGSGSQPHATAEVYDPGNNKWDFTTNTMQTARYGHTATLLPSGTVLVAGGYDGKAYQKTADLYNPGTNSWGPAIAMADPRDDHTATRLLDGRVLVVGGRNEAVFLASAEVYEPIPPVSLAPSSLDFGAVPVKDTTAAETVMLLNSGISPLTISAVAIGGSNPADFAITKDGCTAMKVVQVNASCQVSVTFSPQDTGPRSATLSFSGGAPGSSKEMQLSGYGAPAALPPPPPPGGGSPGVPGSTYTLALSAGAGGSATGGGSYPAGQVASLVATPDAGQVFLGWTVDGAFLGWANPLTLTMDGDHSVAAAFAPRPSFPDVAGDHPAYEAISQLAARGVIKGYADGRFGPQDSTLRAQMAALIARAMGWDAEDHGNPFPDRGSVDADLWRNVGTLAYYQVAKGYQDGSYKPTNQVLNAQVISFITRAMVTKGYWQAQPDDPTLYPDVPATSGHRADLATYAYYAGAVPDTDPAGWGGWAQPSTRGWFALAQWQALDRYFGVDHVP